MPEVDSEEESGLASGPGAAALPGFRTAGTEAGATARAKTKTGEVVPESLSQSGSGSGAETETDEAG